MPEIKSTMPHFGSLSDESQKQGIGDNELDLVASDKLKISLDFIPVKHFVILIS